MHYDYSLMDQVDMVSGFLEKMHIQRPHFLVHDYGNSVLQELLARQLEGRLPFDIQSACFLNGGLFPEMHQPVLCRNCSSVQWGQW